MTPTSTTFGQHDFVDGGYRGRRTRGKGVHVQGDLQSRHQRSGVSEDVQRLRYTNENLDVPGNYRIQDLVFGTRLSGIHDRQRALPNRSRLTVRLGATSLPRRTDGYRSASLVGSW
jgi:hypothetical protein